MDIPNRVQLRAQHVLPTREILEQVLSDSYIAYETLQDALPELEMEQDWQWYTPHKAWYGKGQYYWTTRKGTKKEKTLYWLYVYEDYFTIAIWFKEKNRTELLKSNVSEQTKQTICNAKTEMGLPTFPVIFKITTTKPLADVYTLIEYKKRLEAK